MKITSRDLDLLGWILEQKFMTEKQVRAVFWKEVSEKSCETYKRLNELQKGGFLKTEKKRTHTNEIYLVTKKGIGQLKEFNRDRGLCELSDESYSNYRHDLAVTDIRILFHKLGYSYWLSERVLSRREGLRRVPDGMIFNNNKYIAVEFESSQKSKRRYREIFYNYQLDNQVDKVLYIVNSPELAEKVSRGASICSKLHFVSFDDIQRDLINTKLKSGSDGRSLHELLEFAK